MIIYTIGNSLNGSINQQKAVRGYFYALVKGNSYLNTKADLAEFKQNGITRIGTASLGWRERSENDGKNSFAPCFSFPQLTKGGATDECDKPDRSSDSTRHIRVYTYYGVCGATYVIDSSSNSGFYEIQPGAQTGENSCILGK